MKNPVSVPRRGSADGATEGADLRGANLRGFQSPEGVVLTVQLNRAAMWANKSLRFQSPEGVVLTVQPSYFARHAIDADAFQSPEGVVLTVQHEGLGPRQP